MKEVKKGFASNGMSPNGKKGKKDVRKRHRGINKVFLCGSKKNVVKKGETGEK